MSASPNADRGPTRPANIPSRFAMNGAEARAASPIGSTPPRRAIVGSSAPTSAIVTPMPMAATKSKARFRPTARRSGRVARDGRSTRYLVTALLACEVSCRARRGFAVAVGPRFAPGGGSPVLSRGGSATDNDTSPGRFRPMGRPSGAWQDRRGAQLAVSRPSCRNASTSPAETGASNVRSRTRSKAIASVAPVGSGWTSRIRMPEAVRSRYSSSALSIG